MAVLFNTILGTHSGGGAGSDISLTMRLTYSTQFYENNEGVWRSVVNNNAVINISVSGETAIASPTSFTGNSSARASEDQMRSIISGITISVNPSVRTLSLDDSTEYYINKDGSMIKVEKTEYESFMAQLEKEAADYAENNEQ